MRGIYFALLGAEVLTDATYVDVLLVELPTFVWFTATTLMVLYYFNGYFFQRIAQTILQVLFWIVFLASIWNENSMPRIRRLKRAFWIVFLV